MLHYYLNQIKSSLQEIKEKWCKDDFEMLVIFVVLSGSYGDSQLVHTLIYKLNLISSD